MTVHSQILRCVNNRLRNTDEAAKLSTVKKPIGAYVVQEANTRTHPSLPIQSEPKQLLTEWTWEAMQVTRRGVHSQRHGIFRQRVSNSQVCETDEMEDLLMLKRANPVYDSDDEGDDYQESPLKRQRSTSIEEEDDSVVGALSWDEQLAEDEIVGFSLDSPVSTGSPIGAH